jgi:hypothetical protein
MTLFPRRTVSEPSNGFVIAFVLARKTRSMVKKPSDGEESIHCGVCFVGVISCQYLLNISQLLIGRLVSVNLEQFKLEA